MELQRILIIQTAFIGDVVLATPVIKKLRKQFPRSKIDFLLRKGNEELLLHDPAVDNLLVWDKQRSRFGEIWRLMRAIRKKRYDLLVNAQRFASMGLLTCMSGARITTGFRKNPFSAFFTYRYSHDFDVDTHEIDRNLTLISAFADSPREFPYLVIDPASDKKLVPYKQEPYCVVAPASIWYTKQLPLEKWIEFLQALTFPGPIYLIGSGDDVSLCDKLAREISSDQVVNLAGKLTVLQSASLIKDAVRNYVNDSAPLHLASAFNAPVTIFFCSTVPKFGFGPLSEDQQVMEIGYDLSCRPCGVHGFRNCPKKHFKCGLDMDMSQVKNPQ